MSDTGMCIEFRVMYTVCRGRVQARAVCRVSGQAGDCVKFGFRYSVCRVQDQVRGCVCVLQWCGPGEGPRVPAAPPPACRGAQDQAARHLRDGHDLLWRGRHPGAHPCAAHRPL